MKRLFAALCESATTTLKNGRFLAPPRASRITTISGSPRVEKGVILREVRGGRQGKSGVRLHHRASPLGGFMPRRLVVCLDGTWNKPGQKDEGVATETNVLKLSEALAKLPDQIKDGYRFLRENFQPDDAIYIFGFSRGAYSARSLSGMVLRCGIIKRDANAKFPDLGTDLLTTQQDGDLRMDVVDRVFALYKRAYDPKNRPEVERFKQQYCNDTPVRLVGVWDTVGSLGIPDGVIPFLKKFDKQLDEKLYAFLDTDLNPRVEAAYHAVAIDEHRKPFVPTL